MRDKSTHSELLIFWETALHKISMRVLIIVVFIFGWQDVIAYNITCDELNGNVVLKIDGEVALNLPNKSDCNFDFNLVESFESIGSIAIFAGTSQYGLNAYYDVFIKGENGSKFSFAGNLPISAVRVGVGLYRASVQQGGGIYISTYEVKNGNIKASSISYLLLIDGKVCKSPSGLKVLYPSEAAVCREIKRLKNKPYCLKVENNRYSIVAAKYCEI